MRRNPEDDGLAKIGNAYFMVRSPVGGASHAINPKTKKTYCGHDMVKLWDKWRPMDVLPDDKHQPTCKVCLGAMHAKDRWDGKLDRLLLRAEKLGTELAKSDLSAEDKAERKKVYDKNYVWYACKGIKPEEITFV